MQFDSAVTTTTRTYIIPKVFDQVTKGSPSLMKTLRTAGSWKTGTKYEFPIKVNDTTNGGWTGVANQLDTDRQNVRTTASFEPKMVYKPVVAADIELTLNQGSERIVDLLSTEYDSQAQSLITLMGQGLFTGTGSGNLPDSILNSADDGGAFSTYGGVSRTSYPSWAGYDLQSAGALTLAKMATFYDAIEIGTEKPDWIVTTKALWSVYESLLTPTVRAGYTQNGFPRMDEYGVVPGAQGMYGQQGFECLWFRGTPVVKDEQVQSGAMFGWNSKYFGWKGIDIKATGVSQLNFKQSNDGVPSGVPGRVPSTKGFNFREMMNPVDQFAQVGYVFYAGNFISEQPRLTGGMFGLS